MGLLLRLGLSLGCYLRHRRRVRNRHSFDWQLGVPSCISHRANALHLRVMDWDSICVVPYRGLIHLFLLSMDNGRIDSRYLVILQVTSTTSIMGNLPQVLRDMSMHRLFAVLTWQEVAVRPGLATTCIRSLTRCWGKAACMEGIILLTCGLIKAVSPTS